MSTPELTQQDYIAAIQQLAKTGDLRVAPTARNCFYFVSDAGLQRLQELGVDTTPSRLAGEIGQKFHLDSTPHNIQHDSLSAVVGRFSVSDALRGRVNYISEKKQLPNGREF